MNQRQEIIERLQALKLEGGSHEMLSAICRAVAPGAKYGWTQGACDGLRLRLISFLSETDEETLREAYTKGREDGMGMANAKDARAEYLRGKNDGYDEGWDAGFTSADDWCAQHEDEMAEHGWVRLPKDADGEYIHIGDVMEWPDGSDEPFEVVGIGADTLYYMYDDSCEWTQASTKRHYKQPTVEDLLDEFVERWHDTHHDDIPALKAEYAAKLRLAGGDE